MFVVCRQEEPFSPQVMRFKSLWIYDLSHFHDFWKKEVSERAEKDPAIFCANTAWAAVLKAYGLHFFAPLENLKSLAVDFHDVFQNKISSKNIRETFQVFFHLGFKKVGHLERLSRNDLQKRFGKIWAEFFCGVMHPESAVWPWKPERYLEKLKCECEFEDNCVDSLLMFSEAKRMLENLSAQHPFFKVAQLKARFTLAEVTEVYSFDLHFSYRPALKKDLAWMLKLLEERFQHLSFPYPVWRMEFVLSPGSPSNSLQLSLFESRAEQESLRELCQKLKDQNFLLFQPQNTFSYLPELAWKKISADCTQAYLPPPQGLLRPLIQQAPKAIAEPEGILKFTERLSWFDEKGARHQRDYFLNRENGIWNWVFKNEEAKWFKQGVLE